MTWTYQAERKNEPLGVRLPVNCSPIANLRLTGGTAIELWHALLTAHRANGNDLTVRTLSNARIEEAARPQSQQFAATAPRRCIRWLDTTLSGAAMAPTRRTGARPYPSVRGNPAFPLGGGHRPAGPRAAR